MTTKQAAEFKVLQKKLNNNIEEHERERKLQLNEAIQRYSNQNANARRHGALEKAKLQHRLDIKHKSVTLVGKLEGTLCHHDTYRV